MDRFLIKKPGEGCKTTVTADGDVKAPAKAKCMFRGHELPEGWSLYDGDALLVYRHGAFCDDFRRCAVFDFDDTLALRGSRDGLAALTLPRDLCFKSVVPTLRRLHASAHALVILTNESNLQRLKAPDAIGRALRSKTGRLTTFLDHIGLEIPALVMIATGSDKYRKGVGIAAWDYIVSCSGTPAVVPGDSLMCGDAAGRPKDFSDSDRAFAVASGLSFFTPEQLFGPEAESTISRLCGGAAEGCVFAEPAPEASAEATKEEAEETPAAKKPRPS